MAEPRMPDGLPPELTQRQLEDFLTRLAKRFGPLRGKIECTMVPEVTLGDIGGLARPKQQIAGLALALQRPELHRKWGTQPPSGVLLYGPPGTGKTLLAKALARQAAAIFFQVRIAGIVAKWHADSVEVFHEVFARVKESGRAILLLDEVEALVFDRAAPEEMRAASRRLVSSVAESLDELAQSAEILVVAATARPDGVDPALIRPGRLDRLIEIPLPETDEKREILQIHVARAEALAGRPLFAALDTDALLAPTVKMSGADLAEIVQKTLEQKAHQEGAGLEPGPVTTEDIQRTLEEYRKTKEIVEKIRYGQYL